MPSLVSDTRPCLIPTLSEQPIIADNMYLSLLVETGIRRTRCFPALNLAILRTGWQGVACSFGCRCIFRDMDSLLLDRPALSNAVG